MPVDILRREAILTPFACLQVIADLLMRLQFSYWEDTLAEPATTGLLADSILMVDNLA